MSIIDPVAICQKWVARLGLGFHPDTPAADYWPDLNDAECEDYETDISALFANGVFDPYACALRAMQTAGLLDSLDSMPPARDTE